LRKPELPLRPPPTAPPTAPPTETRLRVGLASLLGHLLGGRLLGHLLQRLLGHLLGGRLLTHLIGRCLPHLLAPPPAFRGRAPIGGGEPPAKRARRPWPPPPAWLLELRPKFPTVRQLEEDCRTRGDFEMFEYERAVILAHLAIEESRRADERAEQATQRTQRLMAGRSSSSGSRAPHTPPKSRPKAKVGRG
jgi:hypothetical protein